MSTNGRPLNLEALGTGDVRKRIEGGADTVLAPIGSLERHGNPFVGGGGVGAGVAAVRAR